jgi:1-acyl-sn-glycerol-3-phosphate acyltransferase
MTPTNETNTAVKGKLQVPPLGEAVPKRGNRFSRALGRALLAAFGWRIAGDVPNLPKLVLIAAPHTSNWDFPLAMAVIFAIGIHVSWMGKHTFVNGPLSPLLRWLGGIPVDRRGAQGVVGQMVDVFNQREQFVLGLAPEGTRKKVTAWKTGFYHIAVGAGVPIVPVTFDYGRRLVRIGAPLYPTGDITADMVHIEAFYQGVVGKNPHQF